MGNEDQKTQSGAVFDEKATGGESVTSWVKELEAILEKGDPLPDTASLSSGDLKPPEPILEKIDEEADRKKRLENDSFQQDMTLRKSTLNRLFLFLAIETGIIFTIAFFQGFRLEGFYLEEWSFRLLTSVTIVQITTMLVIAVQYLFPKK